MLFVLFAVCVAAAIDLPSGALRVVAIAVAVLNGITLVGMMREGSETTERTIGAPLWNTATGIAGVGLLVVSLV